MKNDQIFARSLMAVDVVALDDITNLCVDSNNPETLFLQKEKEESVRKYFDNMTDEAKQVFNIIINGPRELTKLLTQSVIETALAVNWQDKKYAKHVIREIKQFIKMTENRV